jgi:phage-related protein
MLPTTLQGDTWRSVASVRSHGIKTSPKWYVRYAFPHERPLLWIGSSKKDLLALPPSVRRLFGHALDFAQRGGQHEAAKVLKGFEDAGVLEIVEIDLDGTYRAICTVRFTAAVFVLHAFQKKSKRGIATPQADMNIIRRRLKTAATVALELKDEKASR